MASWNMLLRGHYSELGGGLLSPNILGRAQEVKGAATPVTCLMHKLLNKPVAGAKISSLKP